MNSIALPQYAMVSSVQSPYTDKQIAAWLRGLLSIAWADGNFDPEEQALIGQLTHELTAANGEQPVLFKSIEPEELAEELGKEPKTGENFLRTAVLVAIADGTYSKPEADILHRFSDALEIKVTALESLEHTLCDSVESAEPGAKATLASPPHPHPNVLQPMKEWLDGMEVHDPRLARLICKMVPPQCPFERDIVLFGHKLVHIPPMCELNPLYDQLVGLRFRALCYLADDCKEDVSEYV
jgi:tellurite resistance protein